MSYDALPLRWTQKVGWSVTARLWWGECPDANGSHLITHVLREGPGDCPDKPFEGANTLTWHPEPGTPCEHCGELVTAEVLGDGKLHHHAGSAPIRYDTESGRPEPGCLFWVDCKTFEDTDGKCMGGWTNCTGRHLHAICPNGLEWDIDGRANNCTLGDDTTHRCWTRAEPGGDLSGFSVGKADGPTCAAGAGSIQAGDYHGFVTNGQFTAG